MKKSKSKNAFILVAATLLAILFLLPLIFMLFTSFKALSESMSSSALFPRAWTLENYSSIFGVAADVPVIRWLANTGIVTIAGTALVVFVDVLAAYALARLNLPGKKFFFTMVVVALTIPGIVTLFPMFYIFRELNLINTFAPLILIYSANTMGVFLVYSFLKGFPRDLEEAAVIDGASLWQILRFVIFPAIRPVVATLAVLTFLTIYNDFLWPSVVTSADEMKTVTVGVANLVQGANFVNPGRMMAATVVATLPALIIFVAANRYFVRSVISSGIK
ncbi:carbohydrate ABC transporter permease [Planococcus shenhongbingii]|uniref:Carbohydrate ABC transporter permease n=1 Tax=Planococcus shenhongbingii TaxID=3058398 RepID=A0ABT8NH00_9BACL|nr:MULTISPECIES: carbohydrate ABC transporter permease [unclassified Planococcus (in: firmicutes)]MDN7246994.1 carbohydrate ABC transporter permease [Planococcus sp. N017]WKA56896.1 carbohydrate ABC transporter permease [Planococcus sp. N016]